MVPNDGMMMTKAVVVLFIYIESYLIEVLYGYNLFEL